MLQVAGSLLCIVHNLDDLAIDPGKAGVAVVVSGHSHRSHVEVREGVLYVNPGSAGRRRFGLPLTVALLWLGGTTPRAEIVDIEPRR